MLRAQLQCDWHAIADELPRLWARWDPNGDGYVEQHEMIGPGGLLEYMRVNFPLASSRHARNRRGPPPSIARSPDDWFTYWDEDGSGELEQDEVVRALIKTFELSSNNLEQVRNMRDIVHAVWAVFDPDGSGSIDRREFLMQDGLAETIVASSSAGAFTARR